MPSARGGGSIGVWLVTAIWVAVAGGLWAYHDQQLKNGREIALKTVPVDPRDILRGDYVVLAYEISTAVAPEGETEGWYFQQNQVVFVSLEQRGGEWAIAAVDYAPPDRGLYLRGRVRTAAGSRLQIAYGIESYFVPEGEGKRYEEARNRDRLWAVVSVSPHGVAYLKRLEIR